MGVQNHNAIIAVTWSDDHSSKFQKWLDLQAWDISRVHRTNRFTNGYVSFFLPPDGSKEGWQESDEWDVIRNSVIARLQEDDWEDGSSPWNWVEVGFGEYGQKVLRGNNINCYNDAEYATDNP